MSRADAKRNKQARRARDDLSRGVRRKDIALALDGFLPIAEEDVPAAEFDAARDWLAGELRAALGARGGPALAPWLKLGARLPPLLARLRLNDDETRWALLWAAAHDQHWPLAELLLRELEPALRERAAELADAVSALVTSRGALTPAQIPVALRAPASGERAGVHAVSAPSRRASGPPATATEAEGALVDCYASEPWSAFSTLAQRWLRGKPGEPVASAIGLTVAELAALELSSGAYEAGLPRFAVVELLLAATTAALAHDSDDARARCERALLLGLRIVLGALAQPDGPHPSPGLVASAVRAALATSLRESVTRVITELAGRPAAALPPQLVRELYELSPTPQLWARATLALDAEEEQRMRHGRRPRRSSIEWLERSVAVQLAEPDSLQQGIATLETKQRQNLFSTLAAALPPGLVADTVFALWPRTTEARRQELVSFAHEALEASTAMTFCSECDLPHIGPFGGFSDLSAPGRALFERVGPTLAPHDERFLSLALERAQKRSERLDLLDAFTHEAAPIDHYVFAIERARSLGLQQKPFRDRLTARFQGRVLPLARGLDLALDKLGVRSSAARELATALLDAAPNAPAAERSEHVLHQLRLARRIVGGSPQRRRRQLALPFAEANS